MPRLFPFVLILAGLLSGNGFILPAARAQTVTIGVAEYDHDLRDVPPYLLEMLGEAGICLGELEEQLMVGNLIYGERTACNGQEEHGDE